MYYGNGCPAFAYAVVAAKGDEKWRAKDIAPLIYEQDYQRLCQVLI
jgi:hypothetical protein